MLPAGVSLVPRGACIVGRSRFGCQLLWVLACLIPLVDVIVCEVSHHLCCHAKIGGTVDVPHGEGEVEYHKLCIARGLLGGEKGDGREVLHTQPQPHVDTCQLYLSEVDWH